MTKAKNSLSSKLLAVLLVISILIGTIQPTVAKAVENGDTVGTIVTLVNGGEIKDDTVTFSGTKLTWSPKNEAIGRNVDGWWIGIQVNAPAGMDSEQLKNSKYKYANSTESKSFWTYKDSADDAESHNIQLWGVINEEYLINAIANDKTVDYKYEFDWDGDGTYEQPITMSVAPNEITLVKEGVVVYPNPDYATVTPLTGGTFSGDAENLELVIDEATLNWSDVDASVGRHTAGWWVGMKVTAPVGYTAEELQKAYYNRKVTNSTSDTGWSDATKVEFWGAKDSADADAVHHVQMWMVINPSLISTYKELNRNISTSYEFDWNNDGVIDQTIKLTVVPSEKIVLNKVAPEFEVEDVNLTYGTKEHQIVINEIKVGDGKYSYSIEGENNIGASVDENGIIKFTDSEAKVGSITVKVKKEADDTFSELEKTFKVNVSYHVSTANPTVEGQKAEGSDWYSSVVTIKAPNGYVISTSGNELTTSDWADSVTINTDGVIASKYVYLKSVADGFITDGIEIKNIKIDTAAPGNVQLAIGDADKTVWDKIKEVLSFGLFINTDQKLTVSAEDSTSGIKTIEYVEKSITEGEILKVEDLEKLTNWIVLFTAAQEGVKDADGQNVIAKGPNRNIVVIAKVTDYAGNVSYVTSDGMIFDTTKPVINDNKYLLPETEATATVPASGRPLFNTEEISFNVEVTEETVDGVLQSGIKSVTYEINAKDRADDTEYAATESGTLYSWIAGTDLSTEYTGKITVDSSKFNYNYVDITVTVVDNAGNETTEIYKFAIDITEPTIELSYINNESVGKEGTDGRGYFDSERTATVVYTERTENWNQSKANEVLVKTIAKDTNGADVEYSIVWANEEGTTSDEDTHTATIQFVDEVHYNVETPAYTDEAGNTATLTVAEGTKYPYVFSIDKADEDDSTATIEFKEQSWVEKFLNTITFGALFTNVNVEVTVKAEDDFAGIKEIKYLEKTYAEGKQKLEITEDTVKAYTGWKTVKTIDADKDLAETITETIIKEADKNVVIFVWVTDYAGYEKIYSSDGLIVDITNPTPALADNKIVLPETEVAASVQASGRPLYNTEKISFNVEVTEETVDGVLQSGIKSVTYEINAKDRADDTEYAATESGTLYSWIAGTDLSTEYTGKITVDSSKFNYNYVDITVTVVDNAGNETTETYELAIDITEPTIELSYDNNKVVGTEGTDARGYFDSERTVTVVYTERAENWNVTQANDVLAKTIAKDVNGEKVEYVIEWKDVDGATADEDTHTATIKFVDGVHYNVETPAYTDAAGNAAIFTVAEGTAYPYVFSIDKADEDDSTATIEFKEQSWVEKFLNTITFGALFTNADVKVTVKAEDDFAGIKEIKYLEKTYAESKQKVELTEDTVKAYTGWKTVKTIDADKDLAETVAETITKEADKNVVIFVWVTDYAGYEKIYSSDGLIVDITEPVGALTDDKKVVLPETEATATVPASGRPLFNTTTVPFDVKVTEATVDGVLQSGIKSVTYEINAKDRADNTEYAATESGTLYSWSEGTDLSTEYAGKITVDSAKFNYNYVDITVTVVDNAGNETTETYELAIDITEPTIELSYDNNKVVGTEGADGRGYFDVKRTATVVYTERTENWDQSKANEVLAKTIAKDANGADVEYSIVWVGEEGITSDEDTHTATIQFVDEVHYNVETPAYTDAAGNEAILTVAEGTEYPYVFSIDMYDDADSEATIAFKDQSWVKKFLNTITFGALFSNEDVDVTVTVADDFAGIKEIKYLEKTYSENKQTVEITEDAVKAYTGWRAVKTFDADKDLEETITDTIKNEVDKDVVIYVWVTDYAGYEKIYSSDGLIVDITEPVGALTDDKKVVLPETEATATVPASGKPLFNTTTVPFDVKVTEETVDGVLQSGIKSVTYEINAKDRADDTEYAATESGTLYSWIAGTDLSTEYTGKITVDSAKFNYNYVDITVTVVDNAGNETTETYELAIDITDPTIELSYTNNKFVGTEGADGRGYFDAERTAAVVYTERTENWNQSKANEVLAKTIAKDAKDEKVEYVIEWKDVDGSIADEDTHTATIKFVDGVHYNVETPTYTDEAGNEATLTVAEGTKYPYVFSIDMYDDADSEATIDFKEQSWIEKLLNTITFNKLFSNANVDVTAAVADDLAGIREIKYIEKLYAKSVETIEVTEEEVIGYEEWTTTEPITFNSDMDLEEIVEKTISNDKNKNVVIYVWVTDYAGHERIFSSDGLVIDITNPTPALENGKLVYPETEATATVPVSKRPLFNTQTVPFNVAVTESTIEGVLQSGIQSVTYEINAKDRADDEAYVATETGTLYTWSGDEALKTEFTTQIIVDSAKFNYNYVDITVTVVDNAGNETTETYELAIDITVPTIELSYTNNKFVGTEGADERGYFDAERTVAIVYTERTENWNQSKANEVLAKTIAKDAKGEKVEYIIEWTDVDGATADEDTHTATIKFVDGVHYSVEKPAYTDEAGNEATLTVAEGTKYPYVFSIDMYDDADSEATIEFKEQSWIEKFLNAITFGALFSNKNVDVTVTVADDLAGIREIKYLEKPYTEGKQDIEITEEKVIAYTGWETITFDTDQDLEEILERTIANNVNKNVVVFVVVTDYAGYQRVFSSNGLNMDIKNPTPALENGKLVYPETEAEAEVPVSERPLYNSETVTFNVAVTEETPEVAELVLQSGIKSVTYEITAKDRVNDEEYVVTENGTLYSWTEGTTLEDEFTGKITVDSAKFNYNYVDLTVTVVDNAGNETTETYEFAIDIKAPTVAIEYNMNQPLDEANDLGYFNCQRIATITYTERSENWNSDKAEQVLDDNGNVVSQMITALDINGNPVNGAYTIKWEDIEGTTSDEDTHIATVSFNPTNILETADEEIEDGTETDETTEPVTGADARYTLDLSYTDAAGNNIATDENGELVAEVAEGTVYPFNFVIDTVSPEVVSIEYKETITDAIINNLTFNYFGANAEVTVTLKDITAGVNEFDYEGLLDSDISAKNKEVIKTAVKEKEIVQQEDKSVFVVKFQIPKEALTELNSFRGTVRVNAWDYCDNTVRKHDETRLVVDKIAPTCQITFDQPVNEVEGVSYYDKAFTATIVIDEANFYAEDVVINVNGARVMPTDWTQTPGTDIWTSHVSFTAENDYVMTVNYTDRSGNVMTAYESNQRTLDTTEPVINVSNIKHESANNQETIGFTLTITDKNMALANVKPNVTAVVREGDNSANYTYKQVAIDLGTPAVSTNAKGETVYTYTVENLEIDGYYSLLCTVVDHANHSVSNIGSVGTDDRGVAVETVNFSVNRGGSVFWIETVHNDKYSDTTFNNELNGAYANDEVTVKLHEVNVDRVDELEADDKRTVLTLNDGSDSKSIELVDNSNGNGNYDRNVRIGEGGWYETIYTLENDQFAKDGTYSLNIITYDKAENSNVNTKNEEGTIKFVVDRTNPVVTTNVKSGQIIDAEKYTVEFTIAEVNLDESTIVVKVEGKEQKYKRVSGNIFEFEVENLLNDEFTIEVKDLAGNSAEEYKIDDLTVSAKWYVRWFADKTLFWGTIGGAVALTGLFIFIIIWRRRKEDEGK